MTAALGATSGQRKKRNQQDATLRNIRALKARVAKLEQYVMKLGASVRLLHEIQTLELDRRRGLKVD